jgi:CubicO group peptidase (beta-lactamase class C family)
MRLQELDSRRFARTFAELEAALAAGAFPGAVVGIWTRREPDVVRLGAWGDRRRFTDGRPAQPMRVDTVFDLASLTKILGTASLVARLVERGWIGWELPVRALLPELASPPGPEIRLVHLLSHTAGYAAWAPYWERLRDRFGGSAERLAAAPVAARQAAMREEVLAARPEAAAGERAVYSDISFLLLGFALERVTGLPFDRAIERWVWAPLGLRTLRFRPAAAPAARAVDPRVAATEDSAWRGGVLQGQVHDDNCWAMGGYGGHAGAFGTAADTLRFGAAWLEGRFVGARVRAEAWARVPSPPGCERTAGWDTPSGETPAAGHRFRPGSIGHLGFTGTSLWLDPQAGVAVTLLTNRVHPSRENIGIRAARPRIHDAIREDLGH